LNALRDNLSAIAVINEQMDVVGSSHGIEDDQPIPLLSLKETVEPALPVLGKLQEEFLLVTAMHDVPHMTRYVVAICSWHAVVIRLQLSLAISMATCKFGSSRINVKARQNSQVVIPDLIRNPAFFISL
jgi:hypothetical protein